MNKNLTELVFILDRSGSMAGLESDVVGGFNATLEKQRAQGGRVLVSTVLFDDVCEVLHDRVELDRVAPMRRQDFEVRGCTALLDAVGGAIRHIGNIHKYARPADVPAHTIFVITTDGMENASKRYTASEIKKKIERQTEKYGWEFLYLAANIDAAQAAGEIGIRADRAANYRPTARGVGSSYRAMSQAISHVRLEDGVRYALSRYIEEEEEK